jgi:hypothetical protein
MWQDYIGIVPGIAAAVMGIVTLARQKMPHWQKWLIVGLTVIAIGATSFGQWWTLHEKSTQETRRTATLESIGSLIGDGERIMNDIASRPPGAPMSPFDINDINDWSKRCDSFLQELGKSYVVRFNSGAGLGSFSWNNMSAEQNNWLNTIQKHLVRLNEFSGEFSGQIPKRPAGPF